MSFYSQCGEDQYMVRNAKDLMLPHKGTFIEIGGADGIEFSNTAHFEFTCQWNGLIVEPNPAFEESLRKNRRCAIEMCAVASEEGEKEFTVDPDPLLSGFLRSGTNKIRVTTFRLDTLMNKHDIKKVDFLSVDTEGTEVDVLVSAGDRLKDISVILVESATMGLGENVNQIINFLQKDYLIMEIFPWNILLRRRL